MDGVKIRAMSGTVKSLPDSRRRERRRLARAIEARRSLARAADRARHGGRAWINGAEVGGADPRFAHLSASYD